MRPFPTDPDEILSAPFLPEPDWSEFARSILSAVERIGRPGERILVAESDPVAFVAVLMAGISRGCDLFLASPDWRDLEWEQVAETANFHRIFGECPLSAEGGVPGAGSCRIMVPTGGSSGSLRFCVHTPDTLTSAVRSLSAHLGGGPLSSLNCLPLFHVSGLMQVIRAILTGGVVNFARWKSLECGDFGPEVSETKSISLVSTQLARILQVEGGPEWLKQFGRIFLGGGETGPGWIEAIRDHGIPVQFAYGMTETAAMIALGEAEEVDESSTVWARPLPGVKIGLTGAGEIEVETASLFHGYYPESSGMSLFRTGDLGRMDRKGKLAVLGRKDFVINTGGEKVNPSEVEAAILRHSPAVFPVALGLPDPEWGERLVAVLEGAPAQIDVAALEEALKKTLAPQKIPKQFITGIALPRTASGKVDHARLKMELEIQMHPR